MMSPLLLPLLAQYGYQYNKETGFVLSSGAVSSEYLDCRQALSHPQVLALAGRALLGRVQFDIKAVGGLTMGADPLAIGVSLCSETTRRQLRWFSIRKKAKEHGKNRQIEGYMEPFDRICILEDVVTSGASTIQAIRTCYDAGYEILQVLVLVDREKGGLSAIQKELGSTASVQALYTISDIRQAWQALPYTIRHAAL